MKLPYKVNASKYTDTIEERRQISVRTVEEAKAICDRMIAEGFQSYVTKIDADGWETGINYPPVPKR